MNDNTKEISFCTVTYNSAKEVTQLIENIESLKSDLFSSRVFIVDNGSQDDTVNIVLKLSQEHSNLVLIRPDVNRGFGAGNNQVLNMITSDYHILINPDVRIPSSRTIEKMIGYMDTHSDVGLLSPKILNVDGSVQKLFRHNPTVLDMALRFISPNLMKKRQDWFVHEETGYTQSGVIDQASGAFMFFRTSVFKGIAGFDERYFMYLEDADITRKVNAVSKAIFYPEVSIMHKWNRQNHSKLKFIGYTIKSMVQYFNKWGWKLF
ncbi:glycosyltransferase family 2 protein [Lacticaseibacillus paracasei]|uniref:Putative glycosyltransferase WelF n=1 Tax=Lacticaseibacillus paracasei TaxID=1597 RepID=A0A1M4NDJ9_LACPA|nr:glycosyltransferase family 2 protein [Lacticaseibacillus paracasei]RKW80031.1 glycosyltransferase family 2 protein [Lacticaseibacillus paracasei]SDB01577.1 putative glycosyltransferase WelF [Lacticaseibacillus paracasei]